MNNMYESLICPLCSHLKYDEVYQCYQETGYALGRIKTSFVVCTDCGFMFQNPRPRYDLLMNHYEKSENASGAVYHDVSDGSSHSIKQSDRRSFCEKYVEKLKGGFLLEIGCSTGDFLQMLNYKNVHATGLEPSLKAVEIARKNGLDVICESLENNSFPSKSFDVICSFSVLEHLYDISGAIQNMTQMLKDRGSLILEVPDTMKPAVQLAEFFTFEHMSHFTKHTLMYFLTIHGYGEFDFDDTVQDSRLRVHARKSGCYNWSQVSSITENYKSEHQYNRKLLMKKINSYKDQKIAIENELRKRISTHVLRLREQNKKIAIYGAGLHTRYLMNLFDLSTEVTMILDSDPNKFNKKFMRWNVYGASVLLDGEIDAVIISSKAFENEIFSSIEKYQDTLGIEIIKWHYLFESSMHLKHCLNISI